MDLKFNKRNSFNFIIIILIISFIMNIYLSIMNNRYKEKIAKENYNILVDIKSRNENALNIIRQCLKSETVNSQELFSLYENYSYINDAYSKLWINYNDYGKEEILDIDFIKGNDEIIETNLIYSRIEDLIYEYMTKKLENELEVIDLKGQTLQNFILMKLLSEDISDYYERLNNTDFYGLTDEEKEFRLVNKNKWIDSLADISSIMEKYMDKEFVFAE